MKIPYINLNLQWQKEKTHLSNIFKKVLKQGNYVDPNSKEVTNFENNISEKCGTKYAVSLNSGTDALTLGLCLLGVRKGDEVLTPPNSFISSTSAITHIGAKPVFVDVLEDQNMDPNLIERLITKKTKAIMPVHLTGRVAEMKEIMKISKKYNISVIEDAAQSIGSKHYGKLSGSFGKVGCFSAHPLKNLNGIGDCGFLTTDDKKLYSLAKSMRNHGLEDRNIVKKFGFLSRMDVLQAAVLNYRIKNLNKIINSRRKNAKFYLKNLDRNKFKVIDEKKYQFNTYHTFVIQTDKRKKLKRYLSSKGIGTAIHYPIPIHLQPAAKFLGYGKGSFPETERQSKTILTLPIHQNLKKKELSYIVEVINKF